MHRTEVKLRWFGPEDLQELRADMGADFLASELAIPGYPYSCRLNTHNRLNRWIGQMRDDSRTIFNIAVDADQGVDLILSYTQTVSARHRFDDAGC
jgi:hypothetical protein